MGRIRGRAYSQDLRQRFLAARDRGLSARKVAALFEVSVSYMLRARQRRTRMGEVRALKARQVQTRRLAARGGALREKVAMRLDLTLIELCTWLRTEHAVSLGTTALWRELRRLGLTLKKKRSTRPSRSAPSSSRHCSAWRADQPQLKSWRLVFLDKTWASTNMTRRYGRNPRGRTCPAPVPRGHWKTSTFIAGLWADRLVAPMAFGTMHAESSATVSARCWHPR